MVTLFTEDGRQLQYEDKDRLTIVNYHSSGRLSVKECIASNLQSGDYLLVQGRGRNPDRNPDLALVREIAK